MSKRVISYIHREISWLSFNERVMQEAADRTVPLIDRFKFLGIYSSNLDEYFSVRVGSLRRVIKAGIKAKSEIGGKPQDILKKIQAIVIKQRDQFDQIFTELETELEKEDIYIINEKELNPVQEKFVQTYFEQEVRPRLVPIMLNSHPSFPYLKNAVVYLAIRLARKKEPGKTAFALIEIPVNILPRFVVLPKINHKNYIIMLDDVIRSGLKDIFAIFDYDTHEAFTIKLTRDAELDIDDDVTKSFFEKISNSIKQRELGQAVRFVYDRKMPEDLRKFILQRNKLEKFENLIPGGRYHNARDFMSFPKIGSANFTYKQKPALYHKDLLNQKSILAALKSKDILLHYPYQSFHYIIDLLREAAIDPQVKSIKMTLYRLARDSNVINALRNACRNGKDVTVVIELQARFDEEANIRWTKKLEEENARIVDGVPGLKVHAKLCLITRQEGDKKVHYAALGTGNYNEETARIYSDHTLLTADPRITGEVNKLFKFLENNYKYYNYNHLAVSPFFMRNKFYKLIQNEMKIAKAGKPAYIFAKMNSLVDQTMIKKLYKASQAGVQIKLIIRGICSLIPGIKGLSENIEAISIVDKYLEHSRIFLFGNGGEEIYYISSADWMIRNLDNRVEAAVPIYDKDVQQELKDFFMIQFKDNFKSRIFNQKQDNRYQRNEKEPVFRAQENLYQYLKEKLQ
ncbi:MAG: polyphosphate kinase 1 [Calditrichia bacterium]|nr:polyphosphate kinase 1 [Calditrichia bacterium]